MTSKRMRGFGFLVTVLLSCVLLNVRAQDLPDVLAPSNDDFVNAAQAVGEAFLLSADLAGATTEDFEADLGLMRTAWWGWRAPRSGILLWNSVQSSNIVTVSAFVETDFGLELLAASYRRSAGWLGSTYDQSGSVQVQQGRKYYMQLEAPSFFPAIVPSRPVSVSFEYLQELAPTNDSFARSIVLSGINVTFTAHLVAATAEPDEPKINEATLHRTLWWTWQAPEYGSVSLRRVDANATNSISTPVVNVFAPGALLSLSEIASSATEYGNSCERHWAARNFVNFDAIAGTKYYFQVDRFPAFSEPSATFELVLTAAPSNDIPENATILTGADLSLTVSNRGATGRRSEIHTAGRYGASSIWFKWQAPAEGIVQLTKDTPLRYEEPRHEPTTETGVISVTPGVPCSGPLRDLHPLPQFAPVFSLFQGEPVPNTILVNYVGTNRLMWEAASAPYWIQMDGASGTEGESPMNLLFTAPPANDRFTERVRLGAQSVRAFGRTFAATQGSDGTFQEPGVTLSRSVWWEWQAPSAGRWTLFFSGGRYDHRLVLYPENGPGANPLATTISEPMVFHAETGQVFQIAAFARTAFGTSLEFTVTPVTAPSLRFGTLSPAYVDIRVVQLLTPDNSGLPFVIERSSDLVTWTPIVTITNAWSAGHALSVNAYSPANFFRTRLNE